MWGWVGRYDWRVPSGGQDEFFTKLKALVELAFELSGGRKVSLWGISFGPQYALSFLHRMTEEWKDAHINWFVASSAVWSGAPLAMTAFVNGFAGGAGGDPVPNPPQQCAAYTLLAGVCFTGPAEQRDASDLAAS